MQGDYASLSQRGQDDAEFPVTDILEAPENALSPGWAAFELAELEVVLKDLAFETSSYTAPSKAQSRSSKHTTKHSNYRFSCLPDTVPVLEVDKRPSAFGSSPSRPLPTTS